MSQKLSGKERSCWRKPQACLWTLLRYSTRQCHQFFLISNSFISNVSYLQI